jgi:hypothetical protein
MMEIRVREIVNMESFVKVSRKRRIFPPIEKAKIQIE